MLPSSSVLRAVLIQALFLELPAQTQNMDFLAWVHDSRGAGMTLRYPSSLMVGELEDPAEVYMFSLHVLQHLKSF